MPLVSNWHEVRSAPEIKVWANLARVRACLALLHASNSTAGSFVELGALDGVRFSNTIMLERCWGWRGLLVEANPVSYAALEHSGRTAHTEHAAVCEAGSGNVTIVTSSKYSEMSGFLSSFRNGSMRRFARRVNLQDTSVVPCARLDVLMERVGLPERVNFLSLDVEGAEFQVVSTGESLLKRRLETMDPEDELVEGALTPRDYVLGYLEQAFPIHAQKLVEIDGNMVAEPLQDETGALVVSREALALRDAAMMELMTLAPIPSALDQILWAFGDEAVAEVTGRSIRPLKAEDGHLFIEKRAASSNSSETQAFMDGEKDILIFSDAGGTGRSYHAAQTAKNQKRRRHYLLEPGWRADAAIQGLGRTHRSAQVSAPFFRVCTSDVHGEKRFTSTIAKRLDQLGALTKGQRETGSQGMFREEDNLESPIARAALRGYFADLAAGRAEAHAELLLKGYPPHDARMRALLADERALVERAQVHHARVQPRLPDLVAHAQALELRAALAQALARQLDPPVARLDRRVVARQLVLELADLVAEQPRALAARVGGGDLVPSRVRAVPLLLRRGEHAVPRVGPPPHGTIIQVVRRVPPGAPRRRAADAALVRGLQADRRALPRPAGARRRRLLRSNGTLSRLW